MVLSWSQDRSEFGLSEKLQDVPLAITAISGATLAEKNITDVTRLQDIAPGLSIGRSGSDARPNIRGINTEAIGANSDPRIAFYVDDVYQSRTSQALAAFVDLERVEVQRGPQGTLYGRNSFGGNIALYSTVPKETFGADIRLTYVSADDRITLQAYVENLEDHAVLNRTAIGANRSINASYALPRTYGVKAG